MSNIKVLVEGLTEVLFVNEVLKPYLYQKGVSIRPFLLQETGGIPKYMKTKKQILKSIKSEKSFCTTMVDFYGMPKDWPGRMESQSCQNYQDKAQRVEDALLEDIVAQMGGSWNRSQFIPYVQMHEFEALLFSDTSKLAERAKEPTKISAKLDRVLQSFSCPEEINDNYNTCPSRRIKQYIENYVKTVDGIIAVRKIGLETMRQECPHFNEWITKLEDIGNQ